MPDQTFASDVIRKGATRARLYNEDTMVFLYDESNRRAILDQQGSRLVYMTAGVARNAEQRKMLEEEGKKLAEFSKSALLVAYELAQDDPIDVDLIVGEPLEPAERKGLRGLQWHKAQTSRLVLPSGRLRIETMNSCRIDSRFEPQEAGATIKLPAGEYLLTLYRVDIHQTGDAVWERYFREQNGPQEVVVLTPMAATKAPRATSALLPFPTKKDKLSWVGNYAISGQNVDCQICIWDGWELFKLNLDRAALAALNLESGSVLEVSGAGKKFAVLYLEGASLERLEVYKIMFGNERVTMPLGKLAEVAFASLCEEESAHTEILWCMRVKATDNIDGKHHSKWRKTRARLLPQKLELADRAAFGKWRLEQGALHGEVLGRTAYYISMNFDAAALQSLGAKRGELLRLRVGSQAATLRLLEDARQFLKMDKRRAPQDWDPVEDTPWDKLESRFFSAKNEKQREQVRHEMKKFLLDEIPLVGYLDKHWYDPEQTIFIAHPSAREMNVHELELRFSHGLPVEPGTAVLLEKA
jgi:hypothetical protein